MSYGKQPVLFRLHLEIQCTKIIINIIIIFHAIHQALRKRNTHRNIITLRFSIWFEEKTILSLFTYSVCDEKVKNTFLKNFHSYKNTSLWSGARWNCVIFELDGNLLGVWKIVISVKNNEMNLFWFWLWTI